MEPETDGALLVPAHLSALCSVWGFCFFESKQICNFSCSKPDSDTRIYSNVDQEKILSTPKFKEHD